MNISFIIQQPSATSPKQSVKDRLGPLLTANSEPSQDSSVASQVCVGGGLENVLFFFFCIWLSKSAEEVQILYFFPPLEQNSSKVSVKDRLGFAAKPAAPVEKVSVLTVQSYCCSF